MFTTNSFPGRRLVLLGALIFGTAASGIAADEPVRHTLGEDESLVFSSPQSPGTAVRLILTLDRDRVPAVSGREVTLMLRNIEGYIWWSGPVTLDGYESNTTRWLAKLPPKGTESVIIAHHAELVFERPGEAPAELVVTIPRSRLVEAIAGVSPRMADKPFFFNPPKADELPEPPALSADRQEAAQYASAIEQWDREAQAKIYDFKIELMRARSLWRDMRTADRLPWSDEQLDRYEAAYEKIQPKQNEIVSLRQTGRETATNFVEDWNAQHVDENRGQPITLNFYGGDDV